MHADLGAQARAPVVADTGVSVIAVTGRSGSGKTTLLCQLIAELARRGVRVATIKHHAHRGQQVDRPGKDTWRHAQAGSRHVVIAAPDQVASIRRVEREPSLEELAEGIRAASAGSAPAVDVILAEGYKHVAVPSIEIVRSPEWYARSGPRRAPDPANHERGRPLPAKAGPADHRLAIATDVDPDPSAPVPRFPLDDVTGLADLVQGHLAPGASATPGPSRSTPMPFSGQPLAQHPDAVFGAPSSPTLVCIVGRARSGRTTLIEKLAGELSARGHRVGTIKHHAHPGFEIDRPGKDTWLHAQAGSRHVVLASPDTVVSIRKVEAEPPLQELVAGMADVDFVLAEGYLRTCGRRIEVVRAARSAEPLCRPEELLALAADVALDYGVPTFGLDDVAGLADLIEGLARTA